MDRAVTDNERISNFIWRHRLSDPESFWTQVGNDAAMSVVMGDDPDGAKLQFASGRMAEMEIAKARDAEKERKARICCIDNVERYCREHKLYTYDVFLAHAAENEPELAEYVRGLDDVPLGRLSVNKAIERSKVRTVQGYE